MNTPLPNGSFSQTAQKLTASLRLEHSPVAVCLTGSPPPDMNGPAFRAPAGCVFWQQGTSRTFATTAADHSMCAVGVYTHHLESSPAQQIDLADALRVFGELSYVREEDIQLIPTLRSQPQYVVYAPLSETPFAPDVVILFVNANQSLILSEAAQQVEMEYPLAMGRPACAVIAEVINSGRAALSLGCCGARAYMDIFTENVAIFALPGTKLDAYTERIEVLSKANEILTKFHKVRRGDIEAGGAPTVRASLAALNAKS